MREHRAFYYSPIGTIEISGGETGIRALQFSRRRPGRGARPHPSLRDAIVQLDEYFRGRRQIFSLELHLRGTEFQKQVWGELLKIPYGRTVSYGELAAALGRPSSARAVGQANHNNPVSIVIPCHRVIGGDGRLVGYGGGLWRKEWLLAHEKNAFPEA